MRRHLSRAGVAGSVVCAASVVFGLLGASSPLAARKDPGPGAYPDQRPRWSPDGRRLAFTRGTGTIDLPWISLVNRGGTGLRRPRGYYGPFWSPDGQRMATLNGRTLWLADGDGSRQRRIGPGRYTGAWSPDGTLFAFSLGRLYVVNRDGSALRKLPIEVPTCPRCRSSEDEPAWSPDGRSIAFVHAEAEEGSWGVSSIWVADVDGQNLRRLSASFEATSPRWSPDGSRIAYLLYDDFGDASYLHVVKADGSGDRRYGPAFGFSWAPRGGLLAYDSARSPQRVYLVRPDRRSIVEVRGAVSHSWAPDGRRIAFQRRGSIHVADASGRRQRRIALGIRPSWSPDGRLIAYAGAKCGPRQGIHLVNPAGNLHKRLTDFCFIVGSSGSDRIHGTGGTDRVPRRLRR